MWYSLRRPILKILYIFWCHYFFFFNILGNIASSLFLEATKFINYEFTISAVMGNPVEKIPYIKGDFVFSLQLI